MIAPETFQTPERYTAHGRETLDRIRDFAELGGDLMAEEFNIPTAARALAEYLFMFFRPYERRPWEETEHHKTEGGAP